MTQANYALQSSTGAPSRNGDAINSGQMNFPAPRLEQASGFPEEPSKDNARLIGRVAILGSSTMSIGIAMALLDADIPVTVFDRRDALDNGLVLLRSSYEKSVLSGILPAGRRDRRLALFGATDRFHHLKDCDLIIEVMPVQTAVRTKFFRWLDEIGKPDAIMVANASHPALDDIARVTRRPWDVLGLQFSNPEHLSEKLSLVRARDTSEETFLAVARLLGKVGKLASQATA